MSTTRPNKSFYSLLMFTLLIGLVHGAETWDAILKNLCVVDIAVYDGGIWAATDNAGAYRYDKENNTYIHYHSGNGYMSQSDDINDMKIIKNKVWFATNYGIYQCNLNGTGWSHNTVGSDYFSNWIRDLGVSGDTVWVASFTGLFTYSFNSRTYTKHNISDPSHSSSEYIYSLAVTDSLVWIGTEDGLICYDRSAGLDAASSRTYFGDEEIFDGSDNIICRALCATEGGVWVGLEEYTTVNNPDFCTGGLYRYRHGNWSKYDMTTGLSENGVHFIVESDDKMYAGLFGFIDGVNFKGAGMLEYDLDHGDMRILDSLSWHVGNNKIRSFYSNGQDTLVGTQYGMFFNRDSLFRTQESAIDDLDRDLHTELNQNHPNPFNPGTVLTYSIDRDGPVILSVFDLEGKLIDRMVDEHQIAGTHHFAFSGRDLPSGIYIYQLQTVDAILSKKMILMK